MYLKINNESAYCNNTTKTIATQLRDHENNGNKANKQKDAIVTPTTLDPTNALDVIKSIAQREGGMKYNFKRYRIIQYTCRSS